MSSTGNGCGHPGLCLTLSGPLAGTTSGLVKTPDCISGDGLDMEFITHIGAREVSIEIMITDRSARSTPGFHPGSFAIKTSRDAGQAAYASIFVNPDQVVSGFTGGWSSDKSGSSGTVTINGDEGGKVQDAVVAPANRAGASLHVTGSFSCR